MTEARSDLIQRWIDAYTIPAGEYDAKYGGSEWDEWAATRAVIEILRSTDTASPALPEPPKCQCGLPIREVRTGLFGEGRTWIHVNEYHEIAPVHRDEEPLRNGPLNDSSVKVTRDLTEGEPALPVEGDSPTVHRATVTRTMRPEIAFDEVEGDDSDHVEAARAEVDGLFDSWIAADESNEYIRDEIVDWHFERLADERRVAEEQHVRDMELAEARISEVYARLSTEEAQSRVAEERIAALEAQKDGAYSERNKTVIALAWMAHRAGCRVGVREHEGEWDADWRAILMIDLPTGQASWHFHDSERPLLAGFPAYPDEWDGHTTDEKYERLRALSKPAQAGDHNASGRR